MSNEIQNIVKKYELIFFNLLREGKITNEQYNAYIKSLLKIANEEKNKYEADPSDYLEKLMF